MLAAAIFLTVRSMTASPSEKKSEVNYNHRIVGYSDRFAGRSARGRSTGCGAPAIALAAPRLGHRCYQHDLCSDIRCLRCRPSLF